MMLVGWRRADPFRSRSSCPEQYWLKAIGSTGFGATFQPCNQKWANDGAQGLVPSRTSLLGRVGSTTKAWGVELAGTREVGSDDARAWGSNLLIVSRFWLARLLHP